MKTITIKYKLPRDLGEFEMAHFAGDAWSAIDEALQQIRSYKKHDSVSANTLIDSVSICLHEARSKLE